MKKKEQEQKKEGEVILIGEEHQNGAHMPHVTLLVKNKLGTYSNVVVALEQNCGTKTGVELSTPPRLNSRQQANLKKSALAQDLINRNVEKFTNGMVYENESVKFKYIDNVVDIVKHAEEKGKSVSFIGVDTLDTPKKEDIRRDQAMFEGVKKALEAADCVVYPVGSAHIFNSPDEKRLGTKLLSDKGIDLKLANLYPKNSNAYNFVNKDIEAFQTQHPSYQNEVIYQDLSNIAPPQKPFNKIKNQV